MTEFVVENTCWQTTLSDMSVYHIRIFVSSIFYSNDSYLSGRINTRICSIIIHEVVGQPITRGGKCVVPCTSHSISHHAVQLFHCTLICDDLDIDECETDNGGCSSTASCTNTVGSFTCACLPEYSGDGVTCDGKSEENLDILY